MYVFVSFFLCHFLSFFVSSSSCIVCDFSTHTTKKKKKKSRNIVIYRSFLVLHAFAMVLQSTMNLHIHVSFVLGEKKIYSTDINDIEI